MRMVENWFLPEVSDGARVRVFEREGIVGCVGVGFTDLLAAIYVRYLLLCTLVHNIHIMMSAPSIDTLPTEYTTLTTLTLGKRKIASDMSESE